MVYVTQITIVTGAYKPTNITGGPHIVGDSFLVCFLFRDVGAGSWFLNVGSQSQGMSQGDWSRAPRWSLFILNDFAQQGDTESKNAWRTQDFT
jgi:hypothetical protein